MLTERHSWLSLEKETQALRLKTIKELKRNTAGRNEALFLATPQITIDFSNQRVTQAIFNLLLRLAEETGLKQNIVALQGGDKVNTSESRPALHTALRVFDKRPLLVDGQDIIPAIFATRNKIREISNQIREKRWLGFSGKPITDVVNIGIGGSDLGPRFCVNALVDFTAKDLDYHFVSNIDPDCLKQVVAKLNPETTLFIISSKSFTTQETLLNAQQAMAWLGEPHAIGRHFIAVTANSDKAREFGISNVLSIWDWVGGRYSVCSAINLITAIAIGYDQFTQLLAGANAMDRHFLEADFSQNLPVMLGLMGIWNINFLHIHTLLLLAYSQKLEYFVPYIQQLDMESNGKSIDKQGRSINYATGPIVWGGLGNQAQHSYYQLLCQGTHRITTDLITVASPCQNLNLKMAISTQEILATGIQDIKSPTSYIPGNIPVTHIQLKDSTPFTLGQLIALYEHKIFTQSVVWDINPFDQPGVESSKRQNQAVSSIEPTHSAQ